MTTARAAATAVALSFALLVVAPAAGATPAGTVGNDAPAIVGLYPNPATDGDAGEFVVVRFPESTALGRWVLADDEGAAALPNATVSGRVAFSPEPAVARNRTEVRVFGLAGDLALSNGGETVRLRREGRSSPVATVTYADAPEAARRHRDGDGWTWTPLGATNFSVVRADGVNATAFVLPDAPGIPVETLRNAEDRLLLAGYTFTSGRVADALAAAAARNVTVRVLVDDAPVGGLTRREAELLDSLVARGVGVRVLGGDLARYRFHHAKYAVADDRALVTTENWKPAGTGGRGSRGWGVVLHDERTADHLATVFGADAGWRAAEPWARFRQGQRFEPASPANGSYPSRIAPETITAESASVLVAPDNAETELVSLLEAADESIRVQQVGIGAASQPFLRAALRAARRGVEVRILLASAWYVAEENRALVELLNDRADREGLPLAARLADPRGRYGKIHAKGVVVDGDAAVVGSLNWNNDSARRNREVAVVVRGDAIGRYYADAFDADWRASGSGSDRRFPVGLLAAVAVGAVLALLLARREVTFERRG